MEVFETWQRPPKDLFTPKTQQCTSKVFSPSSTNSPDNRLCSPDKGLCSPDNGLCQWTVCAPADRWHQFKIYQQTHAPLLNVHMYITIYLRPGVGESLDVYSKVKIRTVWFLLQCDKDKICKITTDSQQNLRQKSPATCVFSTEDTSVIPDHLHLLASTSTWRPICSVMYFQVLAVRTPARWFPPHQFSQWTGWHSCGWYAPVGWHCALPGISDWKL